MHTGLPDYAELHTTTNFSFLCGASHPEELVERALALGYRGLAITDDCSLAGVVRAHQGWQDAIRAGVPGAEAFRLMIGSTFKVHEEALGEQVPAFTLIVLARRRLGYGLLCEFITRLRRSAQGKGHATLWRNDIRAAELDDCVVLLCPRRGASPDELLDQATWLRRLFQGRSCRSWRRETFTCTCDRASLCRMCSRPFAWASPCRTAAWPWHATPSATCAVACAWPAATRPSCWPKRCRSWPAANSSCPNCATSTPKRSCRPARHPPRTCAASASMAWPGATRRARPSRCSSRSKRNSTSSPTCDTRSTS